MESSFLTWKEKAKLTGKHEGRRGKRRSKHGSEKAVLDREFSTLLLCPGVQVLHTAKAFPVVEDIVSPSGRSKFLVT